MSGLVIYRYIYGTYKGPFRYRDIYVTFRNLFTFERNIKEMNEKDGECSGRGFDVRGLRDLLVSSKGGEPLFSFDNEEAN